MSLPLAPHMLAAAYEYLRSTPPFRGWKLPHADEVKFVVNRHPVNMGTCQGGSTCTIEISSVTVGHTDTMLRTMAHEMIHLRQFLHGEENSSQHNADFRHKSVQVCRYHGWDVRVFV